MAKAQAVVQVGDKQFEMQQFDVPRIGPDDALMRVEACGIRGSAVRLIEAHKYPFEKMHTHSFALRDLKRAIQTLAGRVAGEHAVSVSLNPLL